MLDRNTIRIVKSTAPVLQEHGETLTRHFYKRMFSHNPEVAPFFNHSHQAGGAQQRALAGAIAAYAANIDNVEVLGGAVELIAYKHASLQIKPEHYPIVGENLLASIREVLGEGATDEVIDAWGKAYRFLADMLIGREKQIYAESAKKPGGWEGFRNFVVERKEKESSVITSFYLKPKDGGQLPSYLAGQYITVRMPTSDGNTTMRNYSLSDKPGQDYFRISVKRETGPKIDSPKGYVSTKLHEEIEVGDTLEIGPPCGEFFLNLNGADERPLALLAAGVGITPLMSILKTALEATPERPILFIHGCLNEEVQAFKPAIDALAEKHPKLTVHYRYSDPAKDGVKREGNVSTGFVTAELLESLLPSHHADYYFCGPTVFMVNIYHMLLAWGVPRSQVHFEFFGPRQELEGKGETKAA
ncbi:MAG: NO-inducible flavohemoprotein [Candidatus Binatia bacterium]